MRGFHEATLYGPVKLRETPSARFRNRGVAEFRVATFLWQMPKSQNPALGRIFAIYPWGLRKCRKMGGRVSSHYPWGAPQPVNVQPRGGSKAVGTPQAAGPGIGYILSVDSHLTSITAPEFSNG